MNLYYIFFSFLTICSILIVYFLISILRQNFLLGYMYICGNVTHINSVSFSHNPIEHKYRSPYIKIGLIIIACFSQAPVFGCLNEMFASCVSDFPGLLCKPCNRSRFLWYVFLWYSSGRPYKPWIGHSDWFLDASPLWGRESTNQWSHVRIRRPGILQSH
jgi:hypothetical protein